jgi:16S rRNA (cytidine1402-2'-O)-methyltransferase
MEIKNRQGTLYLLPSPLSANGVEDSLPPATLRIIRELPVFIVEEIRTARRFLKKANPGIDFGKIRFLIFNEHTDRFDYSSFLEPVEQGLDAGILSEAGLPCIADPGSVLVGLAHEKGICVVPLTGPSSLFLALMASGFNGQNFAFQGYLPVGQPDRHRRIKELEHSVYALDQTQVFIETPYRNMQLFDTLIRTCRDDTRLCIACDLTSGTEQIMVRTIGEWKKSRPDLNKRPAVFLLYR